MYIHDVLKALILIFYTKLRHSSKPHFLGSQIRARRVFELGPLSDQRLFRPRWRTNFRQVRQLVESIDDQEITSPQCRDNEVMGQGVRGDAKIPFKFQSAV